MDELRSPIVAHDNRLLSGRRPRLPVSIEFNENQKSAGRGCQTDGRVGSN